MENILKMCLKTPRWDLGGAFSEHISLWTLLFLKLSRRVKGRLRAGMGRGECSLLGNGQACSYSFQWEFSLGADQPPPSLQSSQQGRLLVFLKNHPIYLTSQKPDTWGCATQDSGRACVLYIHTRLFHEFKAFNGIFHYFKNEIKAPRVAIFKQRTG